MEAFTLDSTEIIVLATAGGLFLIQIIYYLCIRNKGCKSSICEIYTLFYTQECKIGCFCIF